MNNTVAVVNARRALFAAQQSAQLTEKRRRQVATTIATAKHIAATAKATAKKVNTKVQAPVLTSKGRIVTHAASAALVNNAAPVATRVGS
jgi:hypothetical protein